MRTEPDLQELKDAHAGERCVILGNAPSLADAPFDLISRERVFVVNRGFRAFDLGLTGEPWLVVSDPRTYDAYAGEIKAAPVGPRFYRSDVLDLESYLAAPEPAARLDFRMSPTMEDRAFTNDLSAPGAALTRGFTVVLDAAQIAFHMGFTEVIVLGVELSTATAPSTHFYGGGAYENARRTDMPVDRVRRSFATARRAFEDAGRRIVNATPGGHLHELERVTIEDALGCAPVRRSA